MTALEKFDRLESTGLWRETSESQSVEVLITFGNSSLILSDFTGSPLTHWSLPAIVRINPTKRPAVFSPNLSDAEKIEIEDSTMINAIEEVRKSIKSRQPKPGKLRALTLLASLIVIIALLIFWLPNVLTKHTSGLVYAEQRTQIGRLLLNEISKLSGPPCETKSGTNTLSNFEKRLFPDNDIKVLVFSRGIKTSTHLPGKFILLDSKTVEDFEVPEVAAGFAVVEKIKLDNQDPIEKLLLFSGTRVVLKFLTTGKLNQITLEEYARYLLSEKPNTPAFESILKELQLANVNPDPYAYAIDVTGESTADLIGKKVINNHRQVLSKNDWLSLQSICGG